MVGRVAAAVGVLALAAASAPAAPSLRDPRLRVELVATNLSTSFADLVNSATFLSPSTLLIARRSDGVIRRVDLVPGQVVTPGPVVHDLDILAPSPDDGQAEYGVQGLTLHPSFATNRWVYVRYDRALSPGADTPQEQTQPFVTPIVNVTERYVFDPGLNAGAGGLVFDRLIRSASVPNLPHHGGQHAFGPDGKLYTLFGDQRLSGEVAFNGQPNFFFFRDVGVVSRLNEDGSLPADNPFGPGSGSPDPGATGAWYAYGVRNPFGLSFDPVTGALWITDNGEATFDEITRLVPGADSGATRVFGPLADPRQAGNASQLILLPGAVYVDPAFSWWRTVGVTGIAHLHGSALGEAFDDAIIVGNFNTGYLWLLRLNPARDGFVLQHPGLAGRVDDRSSFTADPVGTPAQELLLGTGFGGVYSGALFVLRSPDGLVYVLTYSGSLYRLSRACPADVAAIGGDPGADGQLTVDDIITFVNAFSDGAGCPSLTGRCCPADLTGVGGQPAGPDGQLTVDDIIEFFNTFSDGCTP